VRRGFGVLILLSVAYIASGVDAQSLLFSTNKTSPSTASELTFNTAWTSPIPPRNLPASTPGSTRRPSPCKV
jgi:hypothetical protein